MWTRHQNSKAREPMPTTGSATKMGRLPSSEGGVAGAAQACDPREAPLARLTEL
jgi:hypothetical protein